MKFRIFTLLVIAVLAASLLTGCAAVRRLDAAEDAVEYRLDMAENAMEETVSEALASDTTQISAEQAQAVALTHAGFTADQVTGLRVNFEIDDGIPKYEVRFREGGLEYEYEIHGETGDILSFEQDR